MGLGDVRCVRRVRLGTPRTALLPYKTGATLQRKICCPSGIRESTARDGQIGMELSAKRPLLPELMVWSPISRDAEANPPEGFCTSSSLAIGPLTPSKRLPQ